MSRPAYFCGLKGELRCGLLGLLIGFW